MTTNQLSFARLEEDKRHNRAQEAEQHRSNVAQETETKRHNFGDEAIRSTSNVITSEHYGKSDAVNAFSALGLNEHYKRSDSEVSRHNKETEELEGRNIATKEVANQETHRHNVVGEFLTGTRNAQDYQIGLLNYSVKDREISVKEAELPSNIALNEARTEESTASTKLKEAQTETEQWNPVLKEGQIYETSAKVKELESQAALNKAKSKESTTKSTENNFRSFKDFGDGFYSITRGISTILDFGGN